MTFTQLQLVMFLTDTHELDLIEAQDFVGDLVDYYSTREEITQCTKPIPNDS
jgi:hypothetical protein